LRRELFMEIIRIFVTGRTFDKEYDEKFGSSDGLFNLGAALAFVQVMPPGVSP